MSVFRILVLVLLAAIVVSLGNGLFHLTKGQSALGRTGSAESMQAGQEHSRKMARALRIRVALSVALFLLLMLGWYFGLIVPHAAAH